jgi:GrpB-like predicted nucleotidyltransferase (UPF0157 family)
MITVVDYDPSWPERFESLCSEYLEALRRASVFPLAIEHVGSTSVPGLAAKPVIDCDIVVMPEDVGRAAGVLVGIGFMPLGELGIPERWAFKEPPRLAGTNTYVVVADSLALRNHLAVRQTLTASSELRDRYGALKKRVGLTAVSIEEYGQAKNDLIQEILAAAGLTDAERASINANQAPTRYEVPR